MRGQAEFVEVEDEKSKERKEGERKEGEGKKGRHIIREGREQREDREAYYKPDVKLGSSSDTEG